MQKNNEKKPYKPRRPAPGPSRPQKNLPGQAGGNTARLPKNPPRQAVSGLDKKSEKRAKGKVKQRRILRNRIKSKPSSSANQSSFWRFLGMSAMQALKVLVVIILLIGFALLGLGSGMLAGYISTAQDVEIGNIQSNLSQEETKILDKDGKIVSRIKGGGAKAEFVPFAEIEHTYIDDAFIAIEDERFLYHPGIDMRRIFSAVVSALLNGGNPTHGGSTITQQTIKMVTGKDDLSAQRKIQEWYKAVQLERTMSKEAIIELYLNLVPMSNNYQGVQAASVAFFNKNAKDLTLAECALLAGIPNRPATYNPMTEYGRRNCLRRMRLVLGTMLENGFITAEEYDSALNQEIIFDFSAQEKPEENIHNWFVEAVLEEVQADLIKRRGYTRELAAMAVYNYGLTIETTLDSAAQAQLEEVFKDESLFVTDPLQLPNTPEHPQAGITVMDNRPGQEGLVRAIVGGFGEKEGNLVFNFATDAKRQPGSSIKPLVVYAPALEVGAISQASFFTDEPMYLNPAAPTTPYPLNYSRDYKGDVTLQYAILMSLNTIAADVYANRLGPEVGLAFLKDCGIDRTDEPYVATALGGFEEGMSTWEMTEAFSVLANSGKYTEPTTYLRVLNQDGTILLDNTERISYQVYKPETTYVLTTMLKDVAAAPWNGAQPTNTIAAGKTGTTENYRDVWFCGYTPYYTASVWYGYANANGRDTSIPLIDGYNACHIWRESMEVLHQNLPPADFERPPGVINMTICAETHLIANEFCSASEEGVLNVLLIEGSPANPMEVCEEHDGKKKKDDDGERPTSPPPLDADDDRGFNP